LLVLWACNTPRQIAGYALERCAEDGYPGISDLIDEGGE
jgi:hypothetical protein